MLSTVETCNAYMYECIDEFAMYKEKDSYSQLGGSKSPMLVVSHLFHVWLFVRSIGCCVVLMVVCYHEACGVSRGMLVFRYH